MRPRVRPAAAVGVLLAAALSLVACGGPGTVPAPTAPATSPTAVGSPAPSASGRATAAAPSSTPTVVAEPTTTNTLPPPPPPTGPAPSTAGELTAAALPVPKGWRTVALDGGEEEGFEGNGTWVHEREPRYAAADVIGVGCAQVTRDDYSDPVAALEGNYTGPGRLQGVGLAMQFADARAATRYFTLYREQVDACTKPGGPVRTTFVEGVSGLADHRRYDDGDWTEIGQRVGDRVVLVILSDPGHKMGRAAIQAVLDQIK